MFTSHPDKAKIIRAFLQNKLNLDKAGIVLQIIHDNDLDTLKLIPITNIDPCLHKGKTYFHHANHLNVLEYLVQHVHGSVVRIHQRQGGKECIDESLVMKRVNKSETKQYISGRIIAFVEVNFC